MVASMVCCESTEAARELVLDAAPAFWEPVVVIAMWLVREVMSLANVKSPAIISAVGWMVTDWLHPDLAARVHHGVGVRATTLRCPHDLEGIPA
jgi:hypothetical protein